MTPKLVFNHKTTKVQQLTDYLDILIASGTLKSGDRLPSINDLSRSQHVSRDTVFKAFLNLKERGLVDSIHGKNYFVKSVTSNVLLLLDEYSPFKESLYTSLINSLPDHYKVDLWFHQYNKQLFDQILHDAFGKFQKYIVMNYDNEKISDSLKKLDKNSLMFIDFGKFEKNDTAYICQDFETGLYEALCSVAYQLSKYKKLVYVLNKKHKHPQSSRIFFEAFCTRHNFEFDIWDSGVQTIEQNSCYLVVNQTDVVSVIKQSKQLDYAMGTDFGLIAYNDNPFYEVIEKGVPAISVDFKQMGILTGEFITTGKKHQMVLPSNVYRSEFI